MFREITEFTEKKFSEFESAVIEVNYLLLISSFPNSRYFFFFILLP